MKRLILILGMLVVSSTLIGCQTFDSMKKDFESDTKGLDRKIEVYDDSGNLIKTYEGENVRVDTNEYGNKVVFIIDGKRIALYNATVVVEEK